MKRIPEILRHNEILTYWKNYPLGSVERAKSMGIELFQICKQVELTADLWAAELRALDREQPWQALGLGSRSEFIERVTGKPEEHHRSRALARAGVVPQPERGTNQHTGGSDIIRPTQHGTSAEYLLRRLQRDRPDLVEKVARGEIRSARAAAIEAGIVKVPTGLVMLRRAWAKATEDERRTFMSELA